MVRGRIASHPEAAIEARADAAPSSGPFAFVLEIIVPWIGREARTIAVGCMLALGGCGTAQRIDVEGVVRDGRTGQPIAHAQITTDDGRALETDAEGHFSVSIPEGEQVIASAEDRCDATARARRGAQLTLNLFPRLELGQELAQVGFDREVRVEVRTRCDANEELEWTQIAGPELGDRMRTEDRGRVLVVRTHAIEELARIEDRLGIVPLDRHGRGDYRFAVALGGTREEVRLTAAPTSAGLFQVPTGADFYLNGGSGGEHAWALLDRPRGSGAEIEHADMRIARLRPDRFGTYLVEHRPSLRQLSIQAGAYEEVPRDCGRDGCHAPESDGWESTAHARTFRRGLEGELGTEFEERCWSCHATGVDVGIDNGGLHNTAADLSWDQPAPDAGAFDRAPRRIRRHGSVWCSACHGPGRIVPPQFRWQYGAKYRAGVCARCHDVDEGDRDANHVSPQVDEWRIAGMSSLVHGPGDDREPALRAGCAQCHSAQGFVAWRRGRTEIPDPGTVEPITCAACHDAHDASRPRALREFDAVDAVAGAPADQLGAGALCATCHRTGIARAGEDAAAPHAPHADMLTGRGARLAEALDGGAHRFIANTCVRCHMTRPGEDDPIRGRAGGHTFSIRTRAGEPALNRAACAPCHGEVAPEDVGRRDWDGDGSEGRIADEYASSLRVLEERLREAVRAANVRDACGPSTVTAADVADLDAELVLVDDTGRALGDCNGDQRRSEGERWMTSAALERPLADAAYDLAFLRADRSGGQHNPAYAFRILEAISRALH
jgi:hypothetical protein